MIANIILILFSLPSTRSEKIEMLDGLSLDWTFTDNLQLSFSLNVPEFITTTYDWISVGFKLPQEGADMVNADGVLIDMNKNLVHDIYATSVGSVYPDVILEGFENVEYSFSVTELEGMTTYSWLRGLDTEDDFDINFKESQSYLLLYAFGYLNESYAPAAPEPQNTGYIEFTLEQRSSYLTF